MLAVILLLRTRGILGEDNTVSRHVEAADPSA
jgi:hypothetical protein